MLWYTFVKFSIVMQGIPICLNAMDKWLTIKELGKYLKMSESKLYRMAVAGVIPGTKVVNQWRFDREEIDHWMIEQRRKPHETIAARKRGRK